MLGENRATTVRDVLIANGVDAGRITTTSMGEHALVTRKPTGFAANRRVTFSFATDAGATPTDRSAEDVARQKATDALAGQVGPPYAAEDHFPRAALGLNAPLPSWRWGKIQDPLKKEMADWAMHYIKEYKPKVAAAKELDPITVEGYDVAPRPIVIELLDEIERDPVRFLGRALGRSAG